MTANHLVERLEGRALRDGWFVVQKIVPAEGMTGANFSVGYTVQHDSGRKGFMKVLDVPRADLTPDPAATLEQMTKAFNFERDLVRQCKEKGMSKVVRGLSEGIEREQVRPEEFQVAQYIIFEMAEEGSLREKVQLSRDFDLAMALRTLHNIATGLAQLHGQEIAHQDMKPSNVMVFSEGVSKVGDLGQSSRRGVFGPHDHWCIAGDPAYAPIEQLYGHTPTNWNMRRFGCDMYQLGGLAVYLFTRMSVNQIVKAYMPKEHYPENWGGSLADILPYLEEYFHQAIENASARFPDGFREPLKKAVRELCHPNLDARGHPRSIASGNSMGLERYISLFNWLAEKAEIQIRRRLQ